MFGKTLFYILLLLGVGVTPYLLSDTQWLRRIEERLAQFEKPDEAEAAPETAPSTTTTKPVSGLVHTLRPQYPPRSWDPAQAGTVASPSVEPNGSQLPLPHLFNFQATPEWIRQNWRGITTCAGELDLQGWRVSYYGDMFENDFAGSVTYYFDRARTVQRIVVHGYTSDASRIIQISVSHYGMRRIDSPEGDVYVANIDQRPIGALAVKLAPLLNVDAPEKQCELLLELNRRNSEYGMSQEFSALMRHHREANELLTPIEPNSL